MQLNTLIRPIYWEPVSGTGEKIAVGALVMRDNQITAHRIIRDDVLDCMYGKASSGALKMIETGLDTLRELAQAVGMEMAMPSVLGLLPGDARNTYSGSVPEALRICAMLHSSLASLDKFDESEETDAPLPEDSNKRFTTEVKEAVVSRRADLEKYFGKALPLLEGGKATRFGFYSPRSIMHFGMLHPVRQAASVKDARARLWELHRAREYAQIDFAALLFAAPRLDDVTLSRRQVDGLKANLEEIEREADTYQMRFLPVSTVDAAADRVIEFA